MLQPEHLAQLKDELRATLEQVEAEEQRLTEQMQPQTLEDVDRIEEKLTSALDELRRRREELQSREQGKEE
jgi:predicted phage gp36 major capsid-like protein